jgi:hypothetical protein
MVSAFSFFKNILSIMAVVVNNLQSNPVVVTSLSLPIFAIRAISLNGNSAISSIAPIQQSASDSGTIPIGTYRVHFLISMFGPIATNVNFFGYAQLTGGVPITPNFTFSGSTNLMFLGAQSNSTYPCFISLATPPSNGVSTFEHECLMELTVAAIPQLTFILTTTDVTPTTVTYIVTVDYTRISANIIQPS